MSRIQPYESGTGIHIFPIALPLLDIVGSSETMVCNFNILLPCFKWLSFDTRELHSISLIDLAIWGVHISV